MSIKIGTLTRERREGKATITVDEQGEVRTEDIRISFLKPTEGLWRELIASEKSDSEQDKATLVAQLVRLEIQSPDIVNEDDTVHALTESDLNALDMAQLAELWIGVRDHFFLQMPASTLETNTNSTSEQASAA